MKALLLTFSLVVTVFSSTTWACAGSGQVCTGSNPCCSSSDQCVGSGDPRHYRGVCITNPPVFESIAQLTRGHSCRYTYECAGYYSDASGSTQICMGYGNSPAEGISAAQASAGGNICVNPSCASGCW